MTGVPLEAAEPGSAPANTFYQSQSGAGAARQVSKGKARPQAGADGTPVLLYDVTKWSGIRPVSHREQLESGALLLSGAEYTLHGMRIRLEGAHATAVVARQAILRHAADHDLEIARCLAHGVIAVLDVVLTDLRGLAAGTMASSTPPDLARPAAGADRTFADGSSATAGSAPAQPAVRSTADDTAVAERPMTAEQKELARQVHRLLDQRGQTKEPTRNKRKRGVRKEAARP
jgi:hypothetical protein